MAVFMLSGVFMFEDKIDKIGVSMLSYTTMLDEVEKKPFSCLKTRLIK